jgi:hypothetical protein
MPVDAGDFIKLIEGWFSANDVDELDQCAFLATWMGKTLLALDEPDLRKRVSAGLIHMIGLSNDPGFLGTLSHRMDH